MITSIVEILATLADTIMLVWFVTKILGVSLYEKLWSGLIPVLQFIVQLLFDKFMPGYSLLPMMIMLAFVFTFAMVLSPKTIWWNALTAIAYITLMMLVSTFLYSVFSFLIENMSEILQGSDAKVRILHLIIAKLLLFFIYELVLVLFKKDISIETPSAIMSLVLTFCTIISLSALMKIAAVVFTLCLITTCGISTTLAKYTTSSSASDTARVAKWGVEVSTSGTMFGKAYGANNAGAYADRIVAETSASVDTAGSDKIVAPGTKNDTGIQIKIKGQPEVAFGISASGTVNSEIFLANGEYAVMVEAKGINAATDFAAKKLYTLAGTTYTRATAFDATATYYELTNYAKVVGRYNPIFWTGKV